jgi:uncharacterized membrane protein
MKGNRSVQTRGYRWLYLIAALLSLGGLADSIYLTVTHLTGENVVCMASSGCNEVLGSTYASIGKFPLASFGALGYFCAFSCATLAAFSYARARTFLTIVVAAMLATTLYLLYVQAFVLHAFCDYCLLSAALTLCLSIVAAVSYFTGKRNPTR